MFLNSILALKFRNVKKILVTQFLNFPIKCIDHRLADPASLMNFYKKYTARGQDY